MFYEMIGFTADHGEVTEPGLPPLAIKGTALFLDFDGVLVDLAETPDAISVPKNLDQALNALTEITEGALALVSGRSVEALQGFLPGFTGAIVGCHGAEMARTPVPAPPAPDPGHVAAVTKMAEGFAATDPAYLAEAKPTGVVLHFRKNPSLRGPAFHFLESAIRDLPGFHIHHSKMAFEVRPDGISKGNAVASLMQEAPFKGRRPVYFGDDITDEPAFDAVNVDDSGVSVKVGDGDTCARHRVNTPAEVRKWLVARLEEARS